jgi:PAS domain S-box-containing protein
MAGEQQNGVMTRGWLVPSVLAAFLLAGALSAVFLKTSESVRRSQAENQARQLAAAVAHDLGERLDRSLSASYALATLVQQGRGRIENFEALASEMIRVYGGISALQLAPGGVISQVVPLAGNESVIGFSPLRDPKQGPETQWVVESRGLGLTGPFDLKQGGIGVLGRYPIFLEDDRGREYFWGLTQVLVRIPDLLAATRLSAIGEGGYSYELWRLRPADSSLHVFARGGDDVLVDPVVVPIGVPNGQWFLSVAPTGGWGLGRDFTFELGVTFAFCCLVALATWLLLRQPLLLRREVAQRTQELRESETQYRALFNDNPVPMVVYEASGTDHRLLDANAAFLASYGYLREEVRGMTVADLHPKEDLPRLEAYFSGPLLPGLRRGGEWRHRRRSGQLIDVELTSLDVQFEGRPARLALAIDITDRKRAEENLRVHNSWLKSVLAHFPGGVTVTDAKLRLVEWNEDFRKLLDFPHELFVGEPHTLEEFIRFNARRGEYGNVDVDAYVTEAMRRVDQRAPHHFERVRPDGTVLEVRGTPLPDGGFVSSYTDITQRKRDEARLIAANQRYEELNAALESKVAERTRRLEAEIEERRLAEAAVRQSADWLREIIDTMPSGIVLWDRDRRLVAWNEAFRRLYPGARDRLRTGMARHELRAAMAACGEAPLKDDPSGDWDRLGQWDRMLPDGRIVSVDRMATSEGGRLVLQSDVTSLRRTAEVLARNERMASLGNLVAGIAHEINTPIGNALMVASALSHRLTEFDEARAAGPLRRSVLEAFITNVRESEDMMQRNLVRAANLIQNFKQVAVDQTSDRRRVFDLATVLEEVRMTLLPRFKHSPFKLDLEAEVGVPLDSYPGALGQIVTNLVENALVHAFDGRESGSIRLLARRLEGEKAEIVCVDDGNGIPAELRPRIFDPFFTTRLGQGGSGLGLSIVLNLVRDLLGGDMRVDSEMGFGTRFVIEIPLNAPAARPGMQ